MMGKRAKAKKSKSVEQFTAGVPEWSIGDPAFAAWLRGGEPASSLVTPYTVMGLSAVIRSVSIISTTIAGLPLRSYERQGDERQRIPSVFDDPFPGLDGQTQFAWVETVLIHLLLWRDAFLWHDDMDRDGNPTVYRPLQPEVVTKVERVNGRKRFTYIDADKQEQTVGTEQITHIPGPSMDTVKGHPFLYWARKVFSAALAGDEAAQTTLSMGIRLAGLVTPAGDDPNTWPDVPESESILAQLRTQVLGNEHAGDIAFINRNLKLEPWAATNTQSQWHETRMEIIGEVERLFGMPPHLLADTEKQTSWGTGVAEQNLGLARFTLMGWSTRIEQVLSQRLAANQFCEFDYKGLLQGTPAEEIELILKQVWPTPTSVAGEGLLDLDEARKILNLPPRPRQPAVPRLLSSEATA